MKRWMVEWAGVRTAHPVGGSCYVTLPRKFLGRDVVVVVVAEGTEGDRPAPKGRAKK